MSIDSQLEYIVKNSNPKPMKVYQSYVEIKCKSADELWDLLSHMQGRYSHARQSKRAEREQKKLRIYLGE
jgi:hypothetical protein